MAGELTWILFVDENDEKTLRVSEFDEPKNSDVWKITLDDPITGIQMKHFPK